MKCKKALALLLSFCMLITLMPAIPAAAATYTVAYNREFPEVAILNAKNGNSTKFYDKLLHDAKDKDGNYYRNYANDEYAYLNYNSSAKFISGTSETTDVDDIDYEDRINAIDSSTRFKTYKYDYGTDSVLYKLMSRTSNLEFNFSTTLKNNKHSHSINLLLKEEMKAYTGYMLYNRDNELLFAEYGSNYDMDKKRVGNSEFKTLNPSASEDKNVLKLRLYTPKLSYDGGDKTCTCESYAEKNVATFRDTRTPKIVYTEVMKNGAAADCFSKGETVTIAVMFDEPIRFANDSATQNKKLGINLLLETATEAEGDSLFAELTKLDKNTLYFEYKIPEDSTLNDKITSISFKPLAGSDLELVQVINDKSFKITAPDGEESDGYSTTTCYITDLAGNPLLTGTADSSLDRNISAYIDTAAPELASIEVSANANNSDIKAALGKTDPTANDYNDKSDRYLASGDTLKYTVYMNEFLDGMLDEDGLSKSYPGFYATTNLKDADGNPVIIKARYACKRKLDGDQYGRGASKGYVTAFDMETLEIGDDWTCTDSNGRIKITDICLADATEDSSGKITINSYKSITDKCGNSIEAHFSGSSVENLNAAVFYLDEEPPAVTTSATESSEKSTAEDTYYVPTPETTTRDGVEVKGFYLPIQINDNQSGANGLKASFAWKNDTSKTRYDYEYVITTGDAQLPADAVWKKATMAGEYAGGFNEFTQVENTTIYIHIRPIEDENTRYNVLNSRICVATQDYAGNKVKNYTYYNANGDFIGLATADFKLDWAKDAAAPVIEKGSVSRVISGNDGTLTAEININDATSIKEVYYIWADSGAYSSSEGAAPAADSSDWKKATGVFNTSSVTASVTKTVTNGTNWSQELWVKASDSDANTSIRNLGAYSYNLEGMKYEISYSEDFTSKASILVKRTAADADTEAALVFMIKTPDSSKDTDGYEDYYVRLLGAKGIDLSSSEVQATIAQNEREAFSNLTGLVDENNTGYSCKATAWTRMKVWSNAEGTEYKFKTVDTSSGEGGTGTAGTDNAYIESLLVNAIPTPTYSGNLNVTIVSGSYAAFTWDETDANIPVSAGVDGASAKVSTEKITLKVASDSTKAENAFENVTGYSKPIALTLKSEIPADTTSDGSDWTPGKYTSLSTLVGLKFRAQIGADKYGWNYEDVDWDNSYVVIQKTGDSSTQKKIPLNPGIIDQEVAIQESYFPDNSESGYYDIWLEVGCKYGKDYSTKGDSSTVEGEHYHIFVDTTETSTGFELINVSYRPDTSGFPYYHYVGEQFYIVTPTGAKYESDDEAETSQREGTVVSSGTTQVAGDSNVIYLPISSAGRSEYINRMQLKAEDAEDNFSHESRIGAYRFKIWNVTNGINLTESEANAYITNKRGVPSIKLATIKNTSDYISSVSSDSEQVYLIEETLNTIAVQIVKANGKDSDVKYYNIYPVNAKATGTETTTKSEDGSDVIGEGDLIFTPDDDADMSEAHVYAAVDVDRTSTSETNDEVKARYAEYNPHAVYDSDNGSSKAALVIELTGRADGTYRAKLLPGENYYTLHTIDKYGNVWLCSLTYSGNKCYTGSIRARVDTQGPEIELLESSEANGEYEATFKITDLSLNAMSEKASDTSGYLANDMDVELSLDDDHATAIGVPNGAVTALHLNSESARGKFQGVNYEYYSSEVQTWTLPEDETTDTGIYEISYELVPNKYDDAESKYDDAYIKLTVKGLTGYDTQAAENGATGVDFKLNITATDVFGNSGTQEAAYTNAANVKPAAYTDGTYAPKYTTTLAEDDVIGNQTDEQLVLTFNTMVKPDASWICPEPYGYSREQRETFPITQNGTYNIGFSDIFGNHWTQELEITQVAVYGSVDVDFVANGVTKDGSEFLPTDLAKGSLTVAAGGTNGVNPYPMMFLTKDESGKLCFLSEAESVDIAPDKTTERFETRNAKISENKTIYLCWDFETADGYLFDSGTATMDDILNSKTVQILPIHITNIANGAPEAEPLFYFEEFGDTYTEAEIKAGKLPKNETTGTVTVSYRTSRSVTPTDDTGSEITFRYDANVTKHTHTFKYKDALGNEGSVSVDLESLGVTFTKSAEPYADKNEPVVDVDIMAKRFGTYSSADAFSVYQGITSSNSAASTTAKENTKAAVTQAFENTGYVQDYNLRLKVDEESDYRIVLLKDEPAAALTYETASEDIAGVSISGNLINIAKEARTQAWTSFTIAVIDNATGDSAATKDNYTYFTILKSDIEKWFDNTAPTAKIETEVDSLYERAVYIGFDDKADNGEETTSSVTMNGLDYTEITDETSKYNGWFEKIYRENGTARVTFYDAAGNTGSAAPGVSGLDTEAPTLTTKWSPCATVGGKSNESAPTLGPVKTAVTAVVESSKPLRTVQIQKYYVDENGTEGWDLIYFAQLDARDIRGDDIEGLEISCTADRVTVRFTEDDIKLHVSVTALNGQDAETEIALGDGVIKTEAPELKVTQEKLYRSKDGGSTYSEPYAVQIKVETENGESVYCNSDTVKDASGKKKKYSTGDNAYTATVYKNGTYSYVFTDEVGNVTSASTTIDSIDNTAPVLTVNPEDTSKLTLTNGSAQIKITPNENVTLSWKDSSGTQQTRSATSGNAETITFTENGVYAVKAADNAGNTSSAYVTIGNISRILPVISFDNNTILVRQGTAKDDADLKTKLETGVNIWSSAVSSDKLDYSYDLSGIDLDTVGVKRVTYKAWDDAGNTASATRFIRVYDKDLPAIMIDGEFVENGSTYALTKGEHKLTMDKLKEITAGEGEPYTVKIKKGMASAGQMKYFKSDVAIASDGSFSLDSKGFYTLYVVTQSRSAFIATLYVQK
jgi:hypothetical protein